jgi:2-methylcitrate dehydratase PrpD
MSTTLSRFARWATELRWEDLPRDVIERARLQHLFTAGVIREVAGRGVAAGLRNSVPGRGKATLLVPGDEPGTSTPEGAVQVHAALACLVDHVDQLFWAMPSPASVPTGWAHVGRCSLEELLVATVIANELGGRLGAATLFGPAPDLAGSHVQALAAAAVAARLAGLEEKETAQAYALALSHVGPGHWTTLHGQGLARGLAVAGAAATGGKAVALAAQGGRGDLALLDNAPGLFERVAYLPLRAAFGGLGETWLTRTLSFPPHPGSLLVQVPVQGVHEILKRHIKAADKRLRVDQLHRIEIQAGFLTCAAEKVATRWPGIHAGTVTRSPSRAIGVLVAAQALGAEQVDPGWLSKHRDEVAAAAGRVEILHDAERTRAMADHLVEVMGPLFAGVTTEEMEHAGHRAKHALQWPHQVPLLHLFSRPSHLDRLVEKARKSSGDFSQVDARAFRLPLGADTKLYTTRGGWWPEHREIPEGSPGWNWEETVRNVISLGAGGEEGPEARQALLVADAGTRGSGWVRQLLG